MRDTWELLPAPEYNRACSNGTEEFTTSSTFDRLPSIIADGYLWSDAEVRNREPGGTRDRE